jgi:ketosteroid isomerase-like protein
MSKPKVQVVSDALDAWNRGDVDAMVEDTSPDFEFVPAIAAGVEGGSVRGPDEFRQFFRDLEETWETFRLEPEEFREIGDQVLGVARLKAKGRGSGVELDQPVFAVTWFRDGKRVRTQTFLEESAAIEAASGEMVK